MPDRCTLFDSLGETAPAELRASVATMSARAAPTRTHPSASGSNFRGQKTDSTAWLRRTEGREGTLRRRLRAPVPASAVTGCGVRRRGYLLGTQKAVVQTFRRRLVHNCRLSRSADRHVCRNRHLSDDAQPVLEPTPQALSGPATVYDKALRRQLSAIRCCDKTG